MQINGTGGVGGDRVSRFEPRSSTGWLKKARRR
jgi:hypothetical protein